MNPENAVSVPTNDPKLETKRILYYLIITFVLTYAIEIGIITPWITGNDTAKAAIGQSLIAGVMFVPAIGVLLTRIITREGFRSSLLVLPSFKYNLRYYLMAWFGPAILTLLGAVIYFLINPGAFDPGMTFLADSYKNAGIETNTSQLQANFLIQILTGIVLGPLMNFINCFGEEWGWRGYLLPKMKGKLKLLPVLLINGVIWGVWHAPLTLLGHNYGIGYTGYPFIGILAMCIFCITLGTIFSYITIKTKSCIPAIFAHGSVNALAAAGIYLTSDGGNPFIGPAPTGIIGGIGFIAVAVVMGIKLMKEEKKASLINR